MKAAAFYFKEPSEEAWNEFKEWAQKWIRDDVPAGMLVFLRADRSCVFTLSQEDKPLNRRDRLKLVEAAADAILSNRVDAEHVKL